jgi:activator of HSP90 ATPase
LLGNSPGNNSDPDRKCTFGKKNQIMKEIKRYYTLHAEPKDVYNALTNQKMLEIWTGDHAMMTAEPNTEFSLWDGSISGLNLEFEQDKKIVQQWYFGDLGADSIVTIKLHPHKSGTSVELLHTNIPDDAFDNISEGWDEDYFGSLKELFI